MSETTEHAHWANAVRYRDLWQLLRRRGYDCDRLGKNPLGARNTVRICEHVESGSFFSLADRPLDQFVHPEVLFGVRLELDNFGRMTRDEFDRWVKRRANANAATNGAPGGKPARKPRVPGGQA
jgi:hypothetical protein